MTVVRVDEIAALAARVMIADAGVAGAAARAHLSLERAGSIEIVPGDPLKDRAGVSRQADVVVLVWSGGASLGAVMAALRRATPDAAIVVIVPQHDELLYVQAIRCGADDCMPLDQVEERSLSRLLLVSAERHRITSSLRAAAFTDDLTGLHNRRGYLQRAALLLKSTDQRALWQIFFDVDDLKQINDAFGHWAGDRALMVVADVLRQAFRSTDIVARVGGDEFAVLASAPADATPESWTARWRAPLAALRTRREFPLSVSVGVAQPDGRPHITAEDLLERADAAMYVAKRIRKKPGDGRTAESPSGAYLISDLAGPAPGVGDNGPAI